MSAPQIVMICLLAVEIGVALGKHGQPREPYNFLFNLISVGILVGLLWWGGFWS